MGGGLRIGRVFGIELVVDVSWLAIAVLVTWAFFVELQAFDDRASPLLLAGTALVGALAFFGSVLVHELSHSVVALRRGIPVHRIRLFVFGGVSEIAQEATTPKDEFAMTIAGPLSSFALGLLFLGVAVVLPGGSVPERMAGTLAFLNGVLGVFNLLPGFPLDGGRVLRSVVWRVTGDYRRATRWAVAGGRALAVLLVAAGVAAMALAGDLFGLWYVFIGWFLWQAAGASLLRLEAQERMGGHTVADLMAPAIRVIAPDDTVAAVESTYGLEPGDPPLPVVAGGRVRGLVGFDDLQRVAAAERERTAVAEAMETVGPDHVVAADLPLEHVVARLLAGSGRLVVVDQGRMVGTLAAGDVERLLRMPRRSPRPDFPGPETD